MSCEALHNRIAESVIHRFNELPGRGKPQGRAWTVLAGIVAEREGASERLRVVSLATGTRCIGVSRIVTARGQSVHDCHAEVLCRRAFQRYLLGEIGGCSNSQEVILERVGSSPTWRLKPGIRLHFYTSALPCGECALVPIHSVSEGSLARKLVPDHVDGLKVDDRNRTGAKPSAWMPEDPKADGIAFHHGGVLRYKPGRSDTKPESRAVCYSCSEKICRWNNVGWQGAWLGRVLPDPLMMTSIVVGGPLFCEEFVRNALFDRSAVQHADVVRPEFHHTDVSFVFSQDRATAQDVSSKLSTPGTCVVWCASPRGTGPSAQSISQHVEGFLDVVIGHTGERQGLKRDRPSVRGESEGAPGLQSWVSPLCKHLMAQEALRNLDQGVGSEVVAEWIRPASARDVDGPASKRPRLGTQEPSPNVERVAYWRLKDAVAGSSYAERRGRFHAQEPFMHWKRKRCLSFVVERDWEPTEAPPCAAPVVDGFSVSLPGSTAPDCVPEPAVSSGTGEQSEMTTNKNIVNMS